MVKSGKAKEPTTLNDVPSFRSLLRIFRHLEEATAPQSRCRRYHLVLVPLLSERAEIAGCESHRNRSRELSQLYIIGI